ncbi:hypothetical protein ACP70R_034714 [Stipagrostis hirtigluma subsp. patula]
MASNYYTQKMEDVANRLLPAEIIVEIGIADAAASGPSHAVMEGLAAHLIAILGLAGMSQQPPHQASAAPYDRRIRQPPPRAWGHEHVAGRTVDGARSRAPQATNGGMHHLAAPGCYHRKNDAAAICPGAVKVFAAAVAPRAGGGANMPPVRGHSGGGTSTGTGVFLPARRHSGSGTGVFLPRAEVYNTGAPRCPGNNGEKAKPPRLMMRQEAPMTLKQHEANANVYQGCPELLALPQEWTY